MGILPWCQPGAGDRVSYYVKRQQRTDDERDWLMSSRDGYVGPIRSAKQAGKEAAAWVSAGWQAWVLESSPEVRAEVRAWERSRVKV